MAEILVMAMIPAYLVGLGFLCCTICSCAGCRRKLIQAEIMRSKFVDGCVGESIKKDSTVDLPSGFVLTKGILS